MMIRLSELLIASIICVIILPVIPGHAANCDRTIVSYNKKTITLWHEPKRGSAKEKVSRDSLSTGLCIEDESRNRMYRITYNGETRWVRGTEAVASDAQVTIECREGNPGGTELAGRNATGGNKCK